MKHPLWLQVLGLAALSMIVGLANNFRPSAHIDWVRDWTPYSKLLGSEAAQPVKTEETLDKASVIPNRVLEHSGISDIGLAEAHDIYTHAADLTLWIDARSPELYEEGHVEGAHLLNFYDQEATIEQIRAQIAERQPEALVIYCKGKDCTDSHHLAEDLQAKEGFSNIFVYKDGFDDWYKAGFPIAGTLAEQAQPVPAGNQSDTQDDPELAASVPEQVLTNEGITDIGLEQAAQIYRYANDFTFWIDARSPELYAAGHIKGAHLLHFYDQASTQAEIAAAIAERQPEALVIYCKGKDCTDSHHLAEDLMGKDLGGRSFTNIFVYHDGYDAWYQAGLPVEGTEVQAAETPAGRTLETPKPAGMYLEHIVRDLVPFFMGLVLLLTWKRVAGHRRYVWLASLVVGAFFIWAAIPKLQLPLEFAKSIWNYDIAPAQIINLSALIMPGFELVCGLGLCLGLWRRGSGLLVSALLVLFIIAVSYNVMRGHEFNCGCTSTKTLVTDLYFAGWNDKLMLLLRDFGLLVMSFMAFRFRGQSAPPAT